MLKRHLGEIETVLEAATFPSREVLSAAGVHRPTQAGISGVAKEGADSVVVYGGYEDDEDSGDVIVPDISGFV
jgi:putative restriction endonuclease